MKNWVQDNIVNIFAIIVPVIVALIVFAFTQYETLTRHDERIKYITEDVQETQGLIKEMRKDISSIREYLAKIAANMEKK
jgi:prefoldin subunit 5